MSHFKSAPVVVASLCLCSVSAYPFGGTGSGPDVIVSAIGPTLTKNGTVGSITAYSMTTVSCNLGEADAIWIDCTSGPNCNQHPVIGQQMFRLKNGRFEQIGMSWLKHGFCAADAQGCGAPYEPNASCDWLGTHATDTYDAFLNGQQPSLGPRSEVQPATGAFPYPYTLGWPSSGDAIYKRLQIKNDHLVPALNPGATYFAESVYITTDEQPVNRYNNTSYRQVLVGTLTGGGYSLSFTGPTIQQKSAIEAWKAADPSVSQWFTDVPNDGRFIVSSKATPLGEGQWHYEYAVYNYNSDRAGQSFTIPLPEGAAVMFPGFSDVEYHSGEPYSSIDWLNTVNDTDISWATQTHAQNVNANALRWSTLYNFRFNCDLPPRNGEATIGLFKPGTPTSVTALVFVPDADCNGNGIGDSADISDGTSGDVNANGIPDECEKPTCSADINGSDAVDVDDLLIVINTWGTPKGAGDINADGAVNVDDLLLVINGWGPCL